MTNNKTNTAENAGTPPIINSVIKVKITYPENIPETLRQEKINHIYDILTRNKPE